MYREEDCLNCGRSRVDLETGFCEKCQWDNDCGDYASIIHPEFFEESEAPDWFVKAREEPDA